MLHFVHAASHYACDAVRAAIVFYIVHVNEPDKLLLLQL